MGRSSDLGLASAVHGDGSAGMKSNMRRIRQRSTAAVLAMVCGWFTNFPQSFARF
jgi:hypothetical protein